MASTLKTPLLPVCFVLTSALFAALLFRPVFLPAQIHPPDVTCDNGDGEYSYRFFTGLTVSVGPPQNGGFAERACAAKLTWGSQNLTVASDAAQVVIDVLGADLGLGKPVVAFQIDNSGDGTHRTYRIYSLTKPPRLLSTIIGAESYVAADTDLDGNVEIWTDDADAIDEFEGVPLKFWDFPPTVVLRFEKKHLVDVSPEFTSHYDAQISELRAKIDHQELAAFKDSDGVLSFKVSNPSVDLHRLMRTKIKIIEIVWAYLYSGRDAEAWSALQQTWPSQDFNRIRTKLSSVHQRGILRGVARETGTPRHKRQVQIYDATGSSQASDWSHYAGTGAPAYPLQEPTVVQPKSILPRRPPIQDLPASDAALELVIDAAGKVHSTKLLSGADPRWIQVSAGWQFIPAFRDGIPVACRFLLSVSDLK
ncbi:MAG: hypothetical protein WCF17_01635 [Terracidiphilus sp.]